MFLLYGIACIPAVAGGVLWLVKKTVTWWEWLLGAAIAFAVTGIIHALALSSLTADVETWSGQLTQTTRYPRWVEQYQVAIYKTVTKTRSVSNGRGGTRTETYTEQVFSHYESRYRTHPEHWGCIDNIGNSFSVRKPEHLAIKAKFGDQIITKRPHKGGFYSGDRSTYVTTNQKQYIWPTNVRKTFENRVKAAPSLFSFAKVPETMKVFPYPEANDWRQSRRLLGTAARDIPILVWDQMNARLGPTKKVNVIMVGFGDKDSSYAHWQQAKWVGGKKNDVVICYGGLGIKPDWAFVFGWTEEEIVKRNLESILLGHETGPELIPLIEKEIVDNYIIKDWSKFDYISVEPPWWTYLLLIIVMACTQTGFYFWAHYNKMDGLSISDK